MAHSMVSASSWIRVAVFVILVVTLAALPVRGCAHQRTTPEPKQAPASTAVAP